MIAFLIATFGGGKGHPLGFLAHHHGDTTEGSWVQFNPHVYCTNTECVVNEGVDVQCCFVHNYVYGELAPHLLCECISLLPVYFCMHNYL